jgi:ABC-type transporter Mla subunit MlaD
MAPISLGTRRTLLGILVIAAAVVLLLIAIRYASLQRTGDRSFTEKERFV